MFLLYIREMIKYKQQDKMKIKEKAFNEIEQRINKIEEAISKHGVGSKYLEKAERVQRDVNLGLFAAGATALLGLTTWALIRDGES